MQGPKSFCDWQRVQRRKRVMMQDRAGRDGGGGVQVSMDGLCCIRTEAVWDATGWILCVGKGVPMIDEWLVR